MNRVLIVTFDDDVPMSDVDSLEKAIYRWRNLRVGEEDIHHPIDITVEYKEVDFESEFTFEEKEDAKAE